jgi:hypothetical protein
MTIDEATPKILFDLKPRSGDIYVAQCMSIG